MGKTRQSERVTANAAAGAIIALEDRHLPSRPGQQSGANQRVYPAADDDDVAVQGMLLSRKLGYGIRHLFGPHGRIAAIYREICAVDEGGIV